MESYEAQVSSNLPPGEPPQNAIPAATQQHQAEGGSDPGQDVPPAGVNVPMRPQGPQPPNRKNKARRRGAECRDRWRLGVEITALVVGFLGLIGLLLTLRETRRSLEFSTRPWIDVSGTKLKSDIVPNVFLPFGTVLENVGKTPAQNVVAYFAIGIFKKCVCSPSSQKEEFGSIAPGKKSGAIADMTPRSAEDIEQWRRGNFTINMCAEVRYEDDFSTRRRTTANLYSILGDEGRFYACPNGNHME